MSRLFSNQLWDQVTWQRCAYFLHQGSGFPVVNPKMCSAQNRVELMQVVGKHMGSKQFFTQIDKCCSPIVNTTQQH